MDFLCYRGYDSGNQYAKYIEAISQIYILLVEERVFVKGRVIFMLTYLLGIFVFFGCILALMLPLY